MPLPDSDHTPNVKRTLGTIEATGAAADDRSIGQDMTDIGSQEGVQTLDSLVPIDSPSVTVVGTMDEAAAGMPDSWSIPSRQSAPSAEVAGQTCLESPTGPESLKPPDRSPVPVLAPATPRTSGSSRGTERYVLVDNFAHGGLGNLWRAEDTAIRREVAFKELLPKALRNPAQIERFIEEAQISGQLEHPGIIPVYDVGVQENGTPYYAMKFVRGSNMEVAIEAMHELPPGSPERQLAFNRLLRQFITVCQAVGYAHGKGVLHRDLKPLNVMLGEFGETIVLDWGLAKLIKLSGVPRVSSDRSTNLAPDGKPFADDEEGPSEAATLVTKGSQNSHEMPESSASVLPSSGSLEATQINAAKTDTSKSDASKSVTANSQRPSKTGTRIAGSKTQHSGNATVSGQRPVQTGTRSAGSETVAGRVMGTPAYMSPEQAQGHIDELDARTDIYSLGAILYKLLSNQQPVARGKVREILDKVIAGLIPPPRMIDPTIPKPLEAICRKAMSKEKTARYPHALEVAADVEAWLSDQPVSAYPDPWHVLARRWAKRHRTLITTSSATLLVLTGSVTFLEWTAAHRIDGKRTDFRKEVSNARALIEQSKLKEAENHLDVAFGLVEDEPRLATELDEIQIQIAAVQRLQQAAERERLNGIQNQVERDLAEVQHALHDQQDFQIAKDILFQVVGRLSSENSLADIHRQAVTQLEAVKQFESFGQEVEQTRIFGGNISGDESLDDIRESKRHALAALQTFEIDAERPDKASSRLRSLGDKSIAKWREGMQEVLVTLAYLETKLAIRDDPADLQQAAQRSLDHLRQAERLGFSSPPMWFLRADLFGLLDQPDESLAARQTAEKLTPQTRLDHYLLGEFKRSQGNYKEALAHFEDALLADPNDFWSLNMLGLCHFQLGQFEAVIPSCTACIARRPKFDWPYLARGVAFGKLQQFDKAHRDIAQSLKLKPQSYHAYLNRGVIQVYQKNYDAARMDFEQASQRKPDQAAPYINLAAMSLERANELLTDSRKPNAAVLANAELQLANVALTAAIERSPQQAAIYSFRGKIRLAQNNPTAALADFEKANKLEVTPRRRAENFQQIGNVHFRSRRLEAALAAYDVSLESNPDDATTIRQRAETLLALKRYEDAVRGFTAVLEKAGPIADVYRGRSVALAALNRHREAINDYTLSLQYEPAPNMLAQRGWAYLLEAPKLAKEDFEEAVRLNPEDPAFYQGLAYANVMLGDHARAVAEIEKNSANTQRVIGQLGPNSWQYLFNPATVYAQAHDKALIDVKLTPERRAELAQQYSQKAVELLRQAQQLAGPQLQPRFLRALRTDPALDPIRQRPEYLEALKSLDPESAAKSESNPRKDQ
ncbi:MAG: protein kinase domain-containing protein [Planctomycetaceae bacterium]